MESIQKSILPIHWELNSLSKIAGHKVTVLGAPKLVDTHLGKAMEFNGVDDGIIIETNPLADATEFTLEVIFKPYEGGLFEQRYIHMEQDDNNRILVELRSDMDWFLDTFIKAGESSGTLYAEKQLHPSGKWYHAALVYKDKVMTHFVNGVEELTTGVHYNTVFLGRTSIGVRLNSVSWYKGIIKTVKVTPEALSPSGFISKEVDILNAV